MGHDTTAVVDYKEYLKFWDNPKFDFDKKKIKKFKEKNEVAYLRRSMNSITIKYIYEFLGCENNYAGCSGDGNHVFIELGILKRASERVTNSSFDDEDKEDYSEFLANCIVYCESENKKGVTIIFG